MSCGGGFGGCGFTTGGGSYSQSNAKQSEDDYSGPEYQPLAAVMGWIVLVFLIVGGYLIAAEAADAKTDTVREHSISLIES